MDRGSGAWQLRAPPLAQRRSLSAGGGPTPSALLPLQPPQLNTANQNKLGARLGGKASRTVQQAAFSLGLYRGPNILARGALISARVIQTLNTTPQK